MPESKAFNSCFCSSKQQGSSEEWAMFHVMFRILEATKGLCLPLPPGKRKPDSDNLTTFRKQFQNLVSYLFVYYLHKELPIKNPNWTS